MSSDSAEVRSILSALLKWRANSGLSCSECKQRNMECRRWAVIVLKSILYYQLSVPEKLYSYLNLKPWACIAGYGWWVVIVLKAKRFISSGTYPNPDLEQCFSTLSCILLYITYPFICHSVPDLTKAIRNWPITGNEKNLNSVLKKYDFESRLFDFLSDCWNVLSRCGGWLSYY
jgi:hypothetical protein